MLITHLVVEKCAQSAEQWITKSGQIVCARGDYHINVNVYVVNNQ